MNSATPKTFAPLYKKVAQRLISDISTGVFPIGSLLPTEAELCKAFGVSRITLRAAIRELKDVGMVASWPGVGTRVVAATRQQRFIHGGDSIDDITQFTRDLIFDAIDATDVVIDSKQRAEWLGCELGEKLVVLTGLRRPDLADADPVCISTHYIRGFNAAQIMPLVNARKGSLASLVEVERDIRVDSARQSIEAARVNAKDALLLHVPRNEAALSSWRWYMGGDGDVLMVSNSLFPRGRYAWSMTVHRKGSS